MTDPFGSDNPRDREIARHFAAMREADARQAPAIPDGGALAQRRSLDVEGRSSPVIPRLAAGVVLALVVGLLALDRSPSNPGDLYVDIMGDSYLLTDSLMLVSSGSSPELIDTLGALDMDVSATELN